MVFDRRGFMKFMAGASTGIMFTPLPWKLLDDVSIWTQNWPWIPANRKGETSYTYAVSKMCPSNTAMKIRLVNGRAVRVLPSPEHPLGGGVSSIAVAELQLQHSASRVNRPLLKAPDGGYNEIGWKEASDLLIQKLGAAKGKTAFISGDETGSTNEVISALADALGSNNVCLMPSEGQYAARAADIMGIKAQLGYDLENSDYVLAIGANIMESWGPVIRNRRIIGKKTPHPTENSAAAVTLAYAGSVQNHTAALAKPWLPIYPGTEGILALGIANALIGKGKTAAASDFGAFKSLAAKYSLDETAKLTGVDPKKLEEVVTSLLAAKSPLVIVGSEFTQGTGAAPIMAGFAINALLGNINKPGGISLIEEQAPVLKNAQSRMSLYKKDLIGMLSDKNTPSLLILHEANPVYALPNPELTKENLKKIPFKIAFSSFMDESAALCDLVLPTPVGLERIDDVCSPYGVGTGIYCITLPASQPVRDVYSTGNTLLYAAKELGLSLEVKLYEELLQEKAKKLAGNFDALAQGKPLLLTGKVSLGEYFFRPDILGKILTAKDNVQGLHLAPYSKLNLGTANTGIPPYNTKTIRGAELDGKLMAVMMNSATAKKQNLVDGGKLKLSNGEKSIPAKLRVNEGVMNDTVAVCLGYGHTALDEFSRNKGANVMELLNAALEPETGLTVWSQASVVVSKA